MTIHLDEHFSKLRVLCNMLCGKKTREAQRPQSV